MDIIFATQNPNKVQEVQSQLKKSFNIVSLLDIGYTQELEETKETLEGNALQKARFVNEKFSKNCFADDTGLEVIALDSAPGVYSARYAGEEKSFEKNMAKVLSELSGVKNREAQFRTVIACIFNGQEFLFEGICRGIITKNKRGEKGFGYDPIFLPEGYEQTFAEMPMSLKTRISHRAKAVSMFADFLNERELANFSS